MEQIIPIIIAAIVFGYQAYNNYQKEQEKARKRNPGQPRQPVGEELPPQERPAAPFDWLEELMGEPRPQQAPVPAPQRPAEAPPVIREEESSPNDIRSPFQSYSGAVSEEEFHRKKRQRQQRSKPQKPEPVLSVQVLDEEMTDVNREFDLRDAVIKAAILERPYKF